MTYPTPGEIDEDYPDVDLPDDPPTSGGGGGGGGGESGGTVNPPTGSGEPGGTVTGTNDPVFPWLRNDTAELWKDTDTGKVYLVIYYPGTDPPVPVMWEVAADTDLDAFAGPGQTAQITEEFTSDEFKALGAVYMGDTDELANFTENPLDVWEEEFAIQSQLQPWLLDPEVGALYFAGFLEGKTGEEMLPEFKLTEWWRTHNEAERAWLLLNAEDPATAAQIAQDNIGTVAQLLREAGVDNASAELVEWIATQYTTGGWSQAYLGQQVTALSDPYSQVDVDEGLTDFLAGLEDEDPLDTNRSREDQVRREVEKWLGPNFGRWSDEHIAKWAGRLRATPDAMIELTQLLQQQRLALFPTYDSPTLTYEDVAAPWRNMAFNVWGQAPDESSGFFHKLVNLNDAQAAGALLRREGLKQGVGKVQQDLMSSLEASFGQVRNPIA